MIVLQRTVPEASVGDLPRLARDHQLEAKHLVPSFRGGDSDLEVVTVRHLHRSQLMKTFFVELNKELASGGNLMIFPTFGDSVYTTEAIEPLTQIWQTKMLVTRILASRLSACNEDDLSLSLTPIV